MSDCPVRAVEDYVITEPIPKDRETEGGLYLPEPQHGQVWATVRDVGPGQIDKHGNRKPMDVEVGDVVLYRGRAGDSLKGVDGNYERVRQRNLLAVRATS